MRPAGDDRGAFFGELWLLAVGARRFVRSDSDGIQHRAALMINPVTGGQPGGERIAQMVRCPVECPVLQVRREAADMYSCGATMAVSSAPCSRMKPSRRLLMLRPRRSHGRGCTAGFPSKH